MYSLVHLAGRQLLPNLLASMALHRRGTLHRMVVIHSDNPTESARPATALFDLLRHLPGQAALAEDDPLQLIEVDEDLQTVLAAVRELFTEHPGERWILNATGGNKMMAFALGLLAAMPEVHGVVYRDIRHGWRRVVPGADPWRWREEPIVAADAGLGGLVDKDNTLDRMPIERLVLAQFAAEDVVARIYSKPLPTPLPDVDGWLWHVAQRFHRGFATYRPWLGEPHDDGGAFECWLATLLLTAGATRVLWSCEGRDEQGNSVFESDVVALHGDRLVFYDVKLQAPDGGRKTEQIRAVRETAMRLGGLSAEPVLVRPNWPATAHVEQFASVLGVKVLHRAHLASLVPELLSPLGIRADGSEVLARVQETLARLDRDASRERTVFQHRKPASKPMGSRRVLR